MIHPLAADPDITILDRLVSAGADIQYQCCQGFCGACRMTLVGGEIEYIDAALACLQEREFLPCCSVAVTDVLVEVPDVQFE